VLTSGAGTISLTSDATHNTSTLDVWAVDLWDTRIQSASGAITLTGTGGKASANSRGIVSAGFGFSVLSNSGDIGFVDRTPVGLTGSYLGLYLPENMAKGDGVNPHVIKKAKMPKNKIRGSKNSKGTNKASGRKYTSADLKSNRKHQDHRVELNREARERGIYGKRWSKGKDLSHTKEGKMIEPTFDIKDMFFDRKAFTDAVDAGIRKAMVKSLSALRERLISQFQFGEGPSRPGQSPRVHSRNRYANLRNVLFGYDDKNKTGVVGSIRLSRSREAVPGILERGGTVTIPGRMRRDGSQSKTRTIKIAARPAAAPALSKALKAGDILTPFRNSVVGK
jgi:hypothetical protein